MNGNSQETVSILIRSLGGDENILSVTNCMTRLRVTVKDEADVKEEAIRSLGGVMGLIHDRKQYYEIVVGPGISRKYADQFHAMGIGAASGESGESTVNSPEWIANKHSLQSRQKESRIRDGLKMIGDIFVPLIPGIITAGLCAGFASLIAQIVPDYESSKVWALLYQLMTLIHTSFMTYITAWAGYRAAERFGATPILGGMLGMITSLEGINQISALLKMYNEQSPLNSVLRTGKGGVLAVIAGAYLLSVIEKKVRSRMPESLDVIFTPLISLLVCVIPYILIVMPFLGWVSGGVVWVFGKLCMSESILVRIVAGYVSTALFLPLVAAGMHHGLVALYSVQLQEIGYVTLYPALAMAGAGQVGTAISLWLKARKAGNRKLCSVISGALPAGLLGIGEPLIYGVTLPLGKPFITAGLGAGFGGALVMAMQVGATTWGPSGLLGVFVMTAGPLGAVKGVLVYLAGLAVSYICSFILTEIFYNGRELIPEKGPAHAGAEEKEQPEIRHSIRHGDCVCLGENGSDTSMHAENSGKQETKDIAVSAPADGKLIPMEEIPDPVFASGTMGPCAGIMPENGNIYAPCDGVISGIVETKHAVLFTASDGREILVHVGIDTVKLNGRGFEVFTEEGKNVREGDLIMKADLDLIRGAGLSEIVITSLCDS